MTIKCNIHAGVIVHSSVVHCTICTMKAVFMYTSVAVHTLMIPDHHYKECIVLLTTTN